MDYRIKCPPRPAIPTGRTPAARRGRGWRSGVGVGRSPGRGPLGPGNPPVDDRPVAGSGPQRTAFLRLRAAGIVKGTRVERVSSSLVSDRSATMEMPDSGPWSTPAAPVAGESVVAQP